MFREKFVLTFVLTTFLLLVSFAGFLLLGESGFQFWLIYIWVRVLAIALGLDFTLVIFMGWEYLNPTETRLPIYLGLIAALILALMYKGVVLLINLL